MIRLGSNPPFRGAIWAAVLTALLVFGAAPARAQLPPDARWRTIDTPNFRVTFPEGLDSLARVAAARAEQAHAELSRAFVAAPRGRTELVVTDHVDISNGYATVTPYRQIVVYARPPVDGLALSHFDDWLELVITHELVHIFHLESGGPAARVLRAVFGRVPAAWPFFPQYAAPRWVVEGIATWYESALTEGGRVRGTQQEMVLRTAALEGRFEDLGQASGESATWPGGARPYIYGALFFDHLLRTYGEARLAMFVDAVSEQWLPYRLDRAARRAFGVSFSQAWRDWEETFSAEVLALAEDAARLRPLTEPLPVTRGARQALYPRVSPDGSALLFARADGKSDSQLRRASLDGSRQERLTRTNGLSVFSWTPDGGVVFSQLERMDPYRIRSDLWVRAPDGTERRVTEGARLDHPSAAPDGRTAVAVQFGPGTASLVEVDLASGAVRVLAPGDPATIWAFPSVSPDGRWIAASRWLEGAFFDVVILDRAGRIVTEVTRDRAVDTAPAWSPDGHWVVWASDRTGIPNLMAVGVDPVSGAVGPVRQVTHVLTGVSFPSVDPSGQWLYFSGYHADGWEIERVPFDPASWTDPLPLDARFLAAEPTRPLIELPPLEVKPYAALRTLYPRYWQPEMREPVRASRVVDGVQIGRDVIGTAVGFSTHGADLVGRHLVNLYGVVAPGGGQVDGAVAYRYAGLGNPVLSVVGEQVWDADGPLLGTRSNGVVDTLWLTERERRASAAVTYRLPGFRVSASATGGAGLVWERRTLLDQQLRPETGFSLENPNARLADLRASFSVSSARAHALSISLEEGASALLQARSRRHLDLPEDASGAVARDRSFDELLGRVQGYASLPGPGFADHVLALRLSGGLARGPAGGASHFRVGGASGTREPITGLGLFGGGAQFFPVRGYPSGQRRGRHAWSASGEYRFPVALLNRGFGLFPLHVDRVSGAFFADAGNAWGAATTTGNERRDPIAAVGAEVLSDVLTFYAIPLALRVGFAVPLVEGSGAQIYLRLGRNF